MGRREELEQQGWELKFTAKEPRLSEYVRMYEELGMEVLVEPMEEDPGQCQVCYGCSLDEYKVVFTRPRQKKEGVETQ